MLLKIKGQSFLGTILLAIMASMIVSCENTQSGLIWSDEFEGDQLNPDLWTFTIGDGCPGLCGFGNQELQYYTNNPRNIQVTDGKLVITARKETKAKSAYTSTKVLTKGLAQLKYGRVEVSAKLPTGKGIWPAIWMLPEKNKYGGWPRSGEIDIMEHVGYNPGVIYGTVHTESFNHMKGTQKGDSIVVRTASEQFHEYAIEWREDKIEWFVDDKLYHTFSNTGNNSDDWPFDHPFHLILNVAVGGTWGGSRGIDDSIWPQSMEIDYVRVYAF